MSMGNVANYSNDSTVVLRGTPVALKSDVGCAFVSDCCRNWEKLFSNSQICEKYGLSIEDWQSMGANRALVRAVREEHQRRIKNGSAAQELAAKEFATAPATLGAILRDPDSNPRHKIEAHRELRATASGSGPESTSNDSSNFTITINLGADEKLTIDAGKITPRTPRWEGDSDVAEGQ
jgi:hypothetical protein